MPIPGLFRKNLGVVALSQQGMKNRATWKINNSWARGDTDISGQIAAGENDRESQHSR